MTQNANVVASKAVAAALLLLPAFTLAADKSQYNVFNSTPRSEMREMETDRPDTTESPYTVDAGHVQIEMSFVDFTHNDSSEAWSIAPSNIKLGLLNNADIQFVFDPYIDAEDAQGFGETQIRFKLNLWGNDGGDTAFAVMPYVSFPTTADEDFNETDHIEGGLILPLAIKLPHEWDLGLMAEVDFLRDESDSGYGTQLLHTATISHAIVGDLNGYLEYVGRTSVDLARGYVALVGTGVTYALNDDIQLDGGMNFGISDAADDFNAFVGVSLRL